MNKTKKIVSKKRNETSNKTKTKKNYSKVLPHLTKEQKLTICQKFPNTFVTFEDKFSKKYDTTMKDPNFNRTKELMNIYNEFIKIPKNIKPNFDYYTWVNYIWLNKPQLLKSNEKYIVQIDDFRIVQHKVYGQLLEIVKEYIHNNHNEKSKQIKNVYESFLKLNNNEQTKMCASEFIEEIDEMRKEKKNVWKLMSFLNKNETISYAAPFSWSLNPDDKEPSIFRCSINSPQLSLLDISCYFEDGQNVEYKKDVLRHYFKYLNDLFKNVFGENHGYHVRDIFDTEVQILNFMICDKYKNGPNNYNRVTTDEAKNKYHFNWKEFAKELGFKEIPRFFITANVNYINCASDHLLENWDNEKWRTYYIYIYIRQMTRWSNSGHQLYYEFFGNFLRGQDAELERDLRPIFALCYSFNTFLTNEYVARYENKQYIEYVKILAEDLKMVFTRIIHRNKWLQPITKEHALKKLHYFKFIIGSPKILREDPLLDYSSDDAWGNLVKISSWRFRKSVQLEGKKTIDIPVIDWAMNPPKLIGTQAYVVNASYTPSKNSIYIPLGYIQPPFIDLQERGIEYNLAHIGDTLAHEMSHSLDDWGSKYDFNGKMNDWWTKKDKKVFKRIQDDIIKQYEVFALRDGIKFDASIGIGEDMADISGLGICMEYLQDFQNKNEDIFNIRELSFKAFFVYYAVQQKQKISKRAIIAQLHTNPHPLDKYRTNVPLSRSSTFRHFYNVKEGDGMWWHTMNKVWLT